MEVGQGPSERFWHEESKSKADRAQRKRMHLSPESRLGGHIPRKAGALGLQGRMAYFQTYRNYFRNIPLRNYLSF